MRGSGGSSARAVCPALIWCGHGRKVAREKKRPRPARTAHRRERARLRVADRPHPEDASALPGPARTARRVAPSPAEDASMDLSTYDAVNAFEPQVTTFPDGISIDAAGRQRNIEIDPGQVQVGSVRRGATTSNISNRELFVPSYLIRTSSIGPLGTRMARSTCAIRSGSPCRSPP